MINNQKSIEKLINLVKKRPPIYDCNLSKHNDREHIERLWKEIAIEMGTSKITNYRCKWASLRNAFARHLRNEKQGDGNTTPQLSRKKKTWYLADKLSFLRSHLCHRQKGQPPLKLYMTGPELQDADEKCSNFDDDNNTNLSYLNQDVKSDDNNTNFSYQNQDVKSEYSASDKNDLSVITDFDSSAFGETIPVVPVAESSNRVEESHSYSNLRYHAEPELENRNLTFFKSVLPDFNKLSDRRQRFLKQEFLTILNKSLDEQEMES